MDHSPKLIPESSTDSPPACAAVGPLGEWSAAHVPFEVPCVRCQTDLRGLDRPVCGKCGLAFDWNAVLPIEKLCCHHCGYRLWGLAEPRCPECGQEFDWSSALSAARTRTGRLFEFLWYDHPVPGFFRSLRLAAFRPSKLWAHYDLHTPPQVGPLLLFFAVQCVLFAYGWRAVARIVDWVMNGIAGQMQPTITFTYVFRVSREFLPFVAITCIVTFVAIQMLEPSKRRLGVGWSHVLRMFVHATVFASLCTGGWCLLEALLDSTLFVTPALSRVSTQAYPMLAGSVYVVGLLVTWAHLRIGLRRYLGMPHSGSVAAATLLIGHLAGAVAIKTFAPYSPLLSVPSGFSFLVGQVGSGLSGVFEAGTTAVFLPLVP